MPPVLMVVAAAIALPLIFYLPGLLISRAIRGATPADLLERHYERVVISTLLNGWLALLLAEVGVFSLWLHLGMVVLVCLVCGVLASGKANHANTHQARGQAGRLEALAFGLVGLIAVLLVIPPFEVVLGVRDAGVYANAGFAIARTGSLVQHDDLLADLGQAAQADRGAVREPAQHALSNFLGVQHPERFIATRMRAAGFVINEGEMEEGRVVPQGFHLFPAWIALLTSVAGLSAGLAAPGVMAVLGAWSVGMLGRRLAGPLVGLLAFLFLALNGVQVWFGRYSTSETTTQFLTFAGLYCFARFQQANDDMHPPPTARTCYAALAGVAFGQFALTRLDGFLVIGPVVLYLLFCGVTRRWNAGHTALALGLGAMLVHTGLHVLFIARAYFFDTAFARLQDYALTSHLALPFLNPTLREIYHGRPESALKDPAQIWRELVVLAVGLGGLLVLWRWPRPLRFVVGLVQRWHRPLAGTAAVAILLLAAYAYLVRPQIVTPQVLTALPSCLLPQQWHADEGACLALQGYVGAPIALPPPPPPPDPAQVRAEAPYAYYRRGTLALLNRMGRDHPRYDEAVVYQQRLLEAVREMQRHGDSPTRQREREDLISHLDTLTASVGDGGYSFDELCRLNVPTPRRDEKYVIPLANLVRVGWYLSPLGVVLGVVGFARWWWRGLNRASWLFLVIGVVGTFFYVRQTYGTSEQTYIYILRRFVAITYPTFSLGIAAALALPWLERSPRALPRVLYFGQNLGQWAAGIGLVVFFAWTGRTLYRHVEYAGALHQIDHLARQFDTSDVVLFRGGAPVYGQFRDVPDLVTTPLQGGFGLNALTIKSREPATYADPLAAQVRTWQQEGRDVFLALSASGGDFRLPGFVFHPVQQWTLSVPEFEQLTDQKPHNVARLTLPFTIYRVDPDADQGKGKADQTMRLDPTDFAAQVRGFYLPEYPPAPRPADNHGALPPGRPSYAWTDGDALLRLPWEPGSGDGGGRGDGEGTAPKELVLWLAGGPRPPHLGPARGCFSLRLEGGPASVFPSHEDGEAVSLDCLTLGSEVAEYRLSLAGQQQQIGMSPIPSGHVLLHLESETWVPAQEDPHQHDQRGVGVQFWGAALE